MPSDSVRIAHLSDPHLEIPPERLRAGTWERLLLDRDAVNMLAVDLVVVTGDLTTFGSSDVAHLELARQWLDGFTAPVLAVPGNHDLGPSPARAQANPAMEAFEPVPLAETGFGRTIDARPVRSVDLRHALVLGIAVREDDPDGALSSLEELLSAHPAPAIVCGHYPIVNPRPGYEAPEFGSGEFVPRAAERLREIVTNAPAPVVYLCGHVHLNSVVALGSGHHQFSAGGLGPGSSTFRVYTVDANELRYSTHRGAGPRRTWAYPDGEHTEEFSLGTQDERTGRIVWKKE